MPNYKIQWTETLTYEIELEAQSTCQAFEGWLAVDKKELDHKKFDCSQPVIECLDE